VYDAGLAIDVAALERDPFLRPQPCADREDWDGAVARVKLRRD